MGVISCNDRLDRTLIVREITQYRDGTYVFYVSSYYSNGSRAAIYEYYSKTKIYNIGDTLKLVNGTNH